MANVPFSRKILEYLYLFGRQKIGMCVIRISGTFSFFNDTLCYITYDPGKSYPYHSEEAFEEAKRIVKSQKANEHKNFE
jgi:hypothetical protein